MLLGQALIIRQFSAPFLGSTSSNGNSTDSKLSLQSEVASVKQELLQQYSLASPNNLSMPDFNGSPLKCSTNQSSDSSLLFYPSNKNGVELELELAHIKNQKLQETFPNGSYSSNDTENGKDRLHKNKASSNHLSFVLDNAWNLDLDEEFLPRYLVDRLMTIYFDIIHPWIPILHMSRFQRQIQDPQLRQRLMTVIHAILSITIRFSDDSVIQDEQIRKKLSYMYRQNVIMRSMEIFSLENVQALVIIAFDSVCSNCYIFYWIAVLIIY